MNCEQCIERLGDAVDETLSSDEREQIEAHCRGCEACRDLLADLKEIRAAAAGLERLSPSPALWNAIAAKVEPLAFAPRPPRRQWAAPTLTRRGGALAAAAALVLTLGTAAWFALGPQPRGTESPAELTRTAATELQLADQHYENAIKSLEQLMVSQASALDPAVAADISLSLQTIDSAIADSRAALKAEPESFVAQTSLLEALRMKVSLLQETVSLMNARPERS
jgi:anti-sigma factor RsiW